MITHSFVFAYLFSLAFTKPIARSLILHESRQNIPVGFTKNGPASETTILNLRAALVQSNISGLEQELYAVSTPGSDRYGQHLAKEEVEEYVKPSTESVSLVNQWLSESGISAKTISPAGDWLEFNVSVSKANELLDADFHLFTSQASGQKSIRTMSYSIPTNLRGHLSLIHPTITFSNPFGGPRVNVQEPSLSRRASDVPSSCESEMTPACLQALYGIPTTLATQSSNVIGVSAFAAQYANADDLQVFLKKFRSDLSSNMTWSVQSVNGGQNDQDPDEVGLEANLDTQYAIGLASGVPELLITVGSYVQGSTDFVNEMLDFANFLLTESNPPQTVTTSYGVDETDVSTAVANQLCNSFMQLGARGTSVLFASGDGGVAGGHGVYGCTTFVPAFPGGCPYITSVGATTGIAETAASFSSGGFSDIFSRPPYQSNAVSSYLSALGSANDGLCNKTGRGFPDVSAQGTNFAVVTNSSTYASPVGVSGTSCSSPTFASVIALLNDELIAAGKSPLGFLNPFLYSSASALNDITSGSNSGCGTNGFPALTGWDPVTGLGSPNYAALKTAAGL